eukprot:898409-Rhodomonas_salina.1
MPSTPVITPAIPHTHSPSLTLPSLLASPPVLCHCPCHTHTHRSGALSARSTLAHAPTALRCAPSMTVLIGG